MHYVLAVAYGDCYRDVICSISQQYYNMLPCWCQRLIDCGVPYCDLPRWCQRLLVWVPCQQQHLAAYVSQPVKHLPKITVPHPPKVLQCTSRLIQHHTPCGVIKGGRG
jgi:hypothetical protein